MKGVIIAAGYGTRFFPVTKTIPKEMLPLIDKPSIDFIIEEFINSGITDILLITSRRKKSLEDYLDREVELESVLKAEGSEEKLKKIAPPKANIYSIRQQEMKGTGHALLLAKAFAANEPFVVAYPDDLHFGEIPLAKQLIDKYNETGCSVLATLHNPPNLNRYGVVALEPDGLHVKELVEKPPVGQEPSKEASIGRYLFTPDLFTYLEEGLKEHTGGEYYHVYGLKKLADKKKLVYHTISGERLDTGEPAGYLRALIHYAKTIPELNEVLKECVKE